MEKIIVQSVKEGRHYFQRQNKKGIPTVGIKCCRLFDVANNILNQKRASQGVIDKIFMLDSISGAVLMEKIIREKAKGDFFIPLQSINYETSVRVWYMLLQIRMGQVTQAYEKSTDKKIEQIKEIIAEYESTLIAKKMYDICRVYQEAILCLENPDFSGFSDGDDYAISDICFEKLTALEKKFWNLFTGGIFKTVSYKHKNGKTMKQCVEISERANLLKGTEFFRGYGISNEIQYAIRKIWEQKQNYGDVCIYYSSMEYEPFLEALFGSYKIPYSMTNRQTTEDNRYVGLMKLVLRWAESNYSYQELKNVVRADGVKNMVKPFYKTIRKNIGWGLEQYKLYIESISEQTDAYEKNKDYVEFLKKLVAVFDVEYENMVSYKTIYERLLNFVTEVLGTRHQDWGKVKSVLYQEIQILDQMELGEMKDVLYILQKRLNALRWNDAEKSDAVVLKKLSEKVTVLNRKYVYFLGLSAAHFGRGSMNSPILSDTELVQYLERKDGFLVLSEEKEQHLIDALYHTLATREEETQIYVGYSSYDTINLRPQAPSVTFLRMLYGADKGKEDIQLAEYPNLITDPICFSSADIWETEDETESQMSEEDEKKEPAVQIEEETAELNSQAEEETSEVKSEEEKMTEAESSMGKNANEEEKIINLSVTALQTFLGCPLQYYYQRVKWLPQEDYKVSNADVWLSPAEKGTLVHEILETYINQWFVGKKSEEILPVLEETSFNTIEEKVVKKMIECCPYSSQTSYQLEREEIKEKCKNYLISMHQEFSNPNNPWVVEACEEKFENLDLYYNENGCCEKEEDAQIILRFEGSIDRLDYRIDDQGQKQYRIIDYKSGRKKKLMEKDVEGKLIQHSIYAKAVLCNAISIKNQDAQVEEFCYHFLFEEEAEKQSYIYEKNRMVIQNKVHKLVVAGLIHNEFSKLEHYEMNKNAKKEILMKTDCSYCTYKDICKEHMGEEL